MFKITVMIAALCALGSASAQSAEISREPICPADTDHAMIRHNTIKPGKWPVFKQAVADHQAWFAAHGDARTNQILPVIVMTPTGFGFTAQEAVTVTRYDPVLKPEAHPDAAYKLFISEYKESSTIKDEVRLCLPK